MGQTRLELGQDQPLKALHYNGCECYRGVVIQAYWRGVFHYWYNGDVLDAHRYNCLGKGQVEGAWEDTCKRSHAPNTHPQMVSGHSCSFTIGLLF